MFVLFVVSCPLPAYPAQVVEMTDLTSRQPSRKVRPDKYTPVICILSCPFSTPLMFECNMHFTACVLYAWRANVIPPHQVLEVAFVSAGALLFGPREEPSKAVASRRLLSSLLLGILRKLSGMGGAEDRLLQPLGRACLAVTGGYSC